MQKTLLTVLVLLLSISFLAAKKKEEKTLCSSGWKLTASGHSHTLGLKSNGSLYIWGDNEFGQLGLGSNVTKHSKPALLMPHLTFKFIAVRSHSSYAITTDGRLFAWGKNNLRQLGNGNDEDQYLPVQVGRDSDWMEVAPGWNQALGLKRDGKLFWWGTGFPGNGKSHEQVPSPIQILTTSTWKTVAAGDAAFAIRQDGALFGWGLNSNGQVGDGTKAPRPTPVRIGGNKTYSKISAGYWHALAIDTEGKLFSWGENQDGELGDGTNSPRLTPIAPKDTEEDTWIAVAAGSAVSLALNEDGTLWYFGDISAGQRDEERLNVPTQVEEGKSFTSVSVGQAHAFGVTTSGKIKAWGHSTKGALGDRVCSKKGGLKSWLLRKVKSLLI